MYLYLQSNHTTNNNKQQRMYLNVRCTAEGVRCDRKNAVQQQGRRQYVQVNDDACLLYRSNVKAGRVYGANTS